MRRSTCFVVSFVSIAVLAGGALASGIEPCPPGSTPEGEPCGADANGGCSSTPPFHISAECGQTFCGNGWATGGTRDTDWYLLDLEDDDGDGVETLIGTLISDFSGVCFVVAGMEQCTPYVVGNPGYGENTTSLEPARATVPVPGLYVIFVATSGFDGFPCGTENEYLVEIECTSGCLGDVDFDGRVGVTDLVEVVLAWGPGTGPADVTFDQDVDVDDLVAVVLAWGECRWP